MVSRLPNGPPFSAGSGGRSGPVIGSGRGGSGGSASRAYGPTRSREVFGASDRSPSPVRERLPARCPSRNPPTRMTTASTSAVTIARRRFPGADPARMGPPATYLSAS
ncbi:hypothetical protein ACFQZ4_40030 [Catellatospora coxensis]